MRKFLILVSVVLLCSCGNSELQNAQKEISKLKKENAALQRELNAYKFSPKAVCSSVESLYESGDLEGLREIEKLLVKYHPEAKELEDVRAKCDKIVKDRKAKEEALKKERMAAVNKLKKKYDDVSGITWYYNPYYTHYDNMNSTSLYIGKSDLGTWLRLKMSYEGESWIFFDKAYLSYDGNTREISFDEYNDKNTDNTTRTWEWIDVSVDSWTEEFLKKLVDGKSVKMRLSGKYSKTKTLSSTEIRGMRDVLNAYEVLKNSN